ncbi:glycoside hydrolase family 25 protein [Mediterraneibacter sp. ICN-202921]|uniref:glycoside hydrolase family 25 protein n=1 Tax=Mediterraneibacter sp. ICN-202921 TaxID=3134657 RepID=UPI0030C2AFC9
MEKKIYRVCMTLLCMLCLTSCRAKGQETMTEQVTGKEAVGEQTRQEETKDTYTFVDVYGQKYEAELLPDVPKCQYDYRYLQEKGGYTYYEDEENAFFSIPGIDVSEFQGEIDWKAVKESGMSFAVIRLGYRGYGEEGKLVLDAKFEQNIQGAQKAGLKTGVYFFSQAVSDTEAKEEAAFVLAQLEGKKLELPVVFDTEEIKGDTARTDGNTREQYTENCKVFCEEIEDAGYDTMIYANMKWMAFTLYMERLTEYDIWYADYEAKPQCPYAFSMWQYSETGAVPGIEGNVDLNIWFQEEEK